MPSIVRACIRGTLSLRCAAQVLHSISSHQLDLLHSMEPYLNNTVVPILKDVKTMWQPSDFLPDSSSPDFLDQVCHHPKLPHRQATSVHQHCIAVCMCMLQSAIYRVLAHCRCC